MTRTMETDRENRPVDSETSSNGPMDEASMKYLMEERTIQIK